jgi:hypothetical protein
MWVLRVVSKYSVCEPEISDKRLAFMLFLQILVEVDGKFKQPAIRLTHIWHKSSPENTKYCIFIGYF